MRNLKNSAAAATRPVKKEPIVIDLDNDDALSGEVKEYTMDDSTRDWDTKIDQQYMKLLDSFRDDGDSHLIDNPLRCIRYEVDNGGYDKREFKAVTTKQRIRKDRNTMSKKNVESKPNVQVNTKKATKEAGRRESVEAMVNTSHVRRNSQHNAKACKKENLEDRTVPDERYRAYLTWLVEKSKCSKRNPGKERRVKCEEVAMALSDSDIIAVEDRPFLDEEDSPFVPSKDDKVDDLEEKRDDDGDQCSSLFRKEIIDILKKPYNEKEFLELKHEASVSRPLTRTRQTLDGREITYETNETKPPYLDYYPDFKRKFKESLREKDRHGALNLLRGFLFYLTKGFHHDAFKPWLDRECLKITSKHQKE